MSAKSRKAGKIIIYILILLILLGCIGFFAYFTNGFTGDLKTFYVECGEQKVMNSSGGFVLIAGDPLDVAVHYTFEFFSEDIAGYTVLVLPNQDFDFRVDGQTYSFAAEENLNAGFDIEYEAKSFSISPKGDMQTILEALYPDKTVAFNKDDVDYDTELFKVVISSEDGSAQVTMLCFLDESGIRCVELDKEVIVF